MRKIWPRGSKPGAPFSFMVEVEFRSLYSGILSVLSIRPTLHNKTTLLHHINAFNYLRRVIYGAQDTERHHRAVFPRRLIVCVVLYYHSMASWAPLASILAWVLTQVLISS